MQRKDIGLIIGIVIFATVFSLILSNALISSPKNRQQEVEVVEPISSDFPTPDNKYFNDQSVNPTRVINISQSSNAQPFSGTSQ